MGSQQRFKVVACCGTDEISSLCRKQICDGPGVVPPNCLTRQDNGSRVHILWAETCPLVLGINKAPKGLIVYPLPIGGIRRKVYRRLVKGLPLCHHEAAGQLSPQPAQQEAGEDDLGSCRTDVDADTRKGNGV